jgi:glucokinase
MGDYVVAVDLGGTQIRAALCDRSGALLRRASTLTAAAEGPERVISRIEDSINEVLAGVRGSQVLGIGLGAPGTVNPWTGVITNATNIPGLTDWPARDYLVQRFKVPSFIGNDANLAALGEFRFGAGKGTETLVYVTISTGIGGGVIERGRLYLGARGWAAELGHIIVEPDGPVCGCGGRGCLEALAAGPAIAREARARLRAGASSSLLAMVDGRLDLIRSQEVVAAARSGDCVALEVMERAALYIGIGMVTFIHAFDPQKIIVGGGVSKAGDLLLSTARAVVAERAMTEEWKRTPIELAQLGDDVGLLGAAALVLTESGSFSQKQDRSA